MSDIRAPWLLYAKAGLLLATGVLASVLLLVESPTIATAVLLVVAVWAFCRSYYFAFYVIEHYADPGFRFAGLVDFLKYALGWKRKQAESKSSPESES